MKKCKVCDHTDSHSNWCPDRAINGKAAGPSPEFLKNAAASNPRLEQKPLERQIGGAHYKDFKIQPIEYVHANGIGFAEGNAIKYISRWRGKGGVTDLRKAIHTLEMLIELEERQQPERVQPPEYNTDYFPTDPKELT